MSSERLFDEIDGLYEKYLDVLEDVCNIESPTADKAAVDKVGEYFIALAKELGWRVNVYPMEKAGDFVEIIMNPEAEGAPITVSGHLDTVHPKGLFGYPAVTRDENNMYGPGVVDCKGGVVAAALAMHALMKVGFKDRPVKLLLQTDEETGSSTSGKETVKLMCALARGSAAFLNLEGKVGETCSIARKGIVRSRITVYGKALHSSRCYEASNAVLEAAYKIIELEKFKDIDGITCNCGVISGGTAPNSVAAECSFTSDIRFFDESELNTVKETLDRVVNTNKVEGCHATIEEISYRPAMPYKEVNEALLKRMNEIYSERGLPRLRGRRSLSGSDAAYVTEAGIPTIDSIGTEGGNIHSKSEFMRLESLKESAKRIAAVIYYL